MNIGRNFQIRLAHSLLMVLVYVCFYVSLHMIEPFIYAYFMVRLVLKILNLLKLPETLFIMIATSKINFLLWPIGNHIAVYTRNRFLFTLITLLSWKKRDKPQLRVMSIGVSNRMCINYQPIKSIIDMKGISLVEKS